MSEYVKPINKTTLTVVFNFEDKNQKMELPHAPRIGEAALDQNLVAWRIDSVEYVPYNEYLEDVRVYLSMITPKF